MFDHLIYPSSLLPAAGRTVVDTASTVCIQVIDVNPQLLATVIKNLAPQLSDARVLQLSQAPYDYDGHNYFVGPGVAVTGVYHAYRIGRLGYQDPVSVVHVGCYTVTSPFGHPALPHDDAAAACDYANSCWGTCLLTFLPDKTDVLACALVGSASWAACVFRGLPLSMHASRARQSAGYRAWLPPETPGQPPEQSPAWVIWDMALAGIATCSLVKKEFGYRRLQRVVFCDACGGGISRQVCSYCGRGACLPGLDWPHPAPAALAAYWQAQGHVFAYDPVVARAAACRQWAQDVMQSQASPAQRRLRVLDLSHQSH